MDKEKLIALRAESENNCRVLYDQLETAKAQIAQIEIELERTRGDFRTYSKLFDEWKDSIVEAPATSAYPLVPPEANRPPAIPKPIPKKENSNA